MSKNRRTLEQPTASVATTQTVWSDPAWRKPVVAVPLSQAFPELGEVKEFRSKTCLFNHDRSKLFDVVSSKYQVVQHDRAVDTVQNALQRYFGPGKDLKASVRSMDGGARMIAEFRLPIAPIQLSVGDVNELLITVRNSYDRTWALDASLGAFRIVCSNGARVGETFGSMSLKHVGGASDEMLQHLDTIVMRAPKLKDIWTEWADTRVEREEAVELLEGQFPDKYLDPIIGERARYPMTKWQLYNHLTRFATHDTRSLRRRVEFDEKISRLFYSDVAVPV